MRDIYEARNRDLESYLRAFKLIPEQKGVLVFIKGQAVGMDFISRENAFSSLFLKLLRSYALEAVMAGSEDQGHQKQGHLKKSPPREKKKEERIPTPGLDQAKNFLERAARCKEKKFKSVGLGFSCRYRGDGMVGAALEVDSSIPHLAFFAISNGHESGPSSEDRGNFARVGVRKSFLSSEE